MDMPLYPGDPLTPGIGATPDAKRLKLEDVKVFTKIPVLPISYADATPFLKALGGDTVPEAWRGALPLTYRVGLRSRRRGALSATTETPGRTRSRGCRP